MSDENGNGVEITTPAGGFKAKGTRTSDLIASLGLALVCVVAWILYDHKADATVRDGNIAAAIKEMTQAQRDSVVAQRTMNCLLSLPQEKREAAFSNDNSLCNRLARER